MKRLEVMGWRNPRIMSVAVFPSGIGLNLHRRGGISITGIPASGGTTICWGHLLRYCDERDRLVSTHRRRIDIGRVSIRIGRDF